MTIEHGGAQRPAASHPVHPQRDESADPPAASPSTANYTSDALRGGEGREDDGPRMDMEQEVAG